MSPPATPPKKPATPPGDTPAPAASPAAAELAPIQSWSYPFATASDKAGAESFFAALAQADSGFYPLGASGLWHGGVHFDSGTGGSLKQADGVRAIADGEVVAYFLNDTYPILDYPGVDGGQPRKALYSTGFVLMHHRLALPPDPSIKPPPANPPADEVLDFYSLVMHQSSWTQYLADGTLKRPRYWKSKRAFRIGKKDQQAASSTDENVSRAVGANVREAPVAAKKKGHYTSGKLIGFLPENSEVIVGTQIGHWGQLTRIVSGAVIASDAGGSTPEENTTDTMGWIYLPEQNSVIEPDPVDSVVVLDPPVALKAGELLGHLGEYQRYRDSSPLTPTTHRPLLHVECFAGSAFPAFLAKSKARAAQLPAAQKTLLVVPKGTSLIARPAAADTNVATGLALKPVGKDDGKSLWVKVQPQTVGHSGKGKSAKETLTPSGSPVWVARASLPGRTGCEAWSAFPLQGGADAGSTSVDRILAKAVLDKRGVAVDDSGVVWHEIDALAGNGSVTGWVSESKTRWESPFAWPGFEVVDATGVSVKDAYERQLVQSNTLLPGEKDKFQPSADVVNNSALMATLDSAMDRSGDKMLDTQELKQAMAVPGLAQGLSRIIGRYESEWGGDMARWQALTPLMKTGEPVWLKELERIEKLQWWSKVGAVKDFPSDPKIYHFHPIGLIENFIGGGCDCTAPITKAQLQAIAPNATDANLSKYIDSLNKAFDDYHFKSCISRAHFMAQVLHESGNFRYTKELGTNLSYDPWRGRGLMQITGQGNYTSYGTYAHEDVTSNAAAMEKLETSPHAMLSAAWYFSISHDLLKYSDEDDFNWITRVINGGYNGYNERLAYFNAAVQALNIETCLKLNKDESYAFETSKVYNEKRGSFAWGLWHDPGLTKTGMTKNKDEALKGYNRYLALDDAAGKPKDSHGNPLDQGWYGIGKHTSVRTYTEQRIQALTSNN